jgi:hypothetical protein
MDGMILMVLTVLSTQSLEEIMFGPERILMDKVVKDILRMEPLN